MSASKAKVIYKLESDLRKWLITVDEERGEDWLFDRMGGEQLADIWKPIKVAYYVEDFRKPQAPPTDFPEWPTSPTFSKRAIEAFGGKLQEHGELLPLQLLDEDEPPDSYYALNVTTFIDALDTKKSDILYDGEDKSMIINIRSFHFDLARLDQAFIFKIPQCPFSEVFVTGDFKRIVEDAGLTGFTFDGHE